MPELFVCFIAFAASALTLFSGFGLGTLLLPAFAAFFPVEMVIAMTAIVHFLNNVFKFFLLGKKADWKIVLRFGLPSVAAALLGAWLLNKLAVLGPISEYTLFGKSFELIPIKLTVAVLLTAFALFDLIPGLSRLEFNKKYLPLGGLLSGFFGGLSGHQGALRSAFLIRSGLSKEAFIATGIIIACMVDISRLTIYSGQIMKAHHQLDYLFILVAVLSAFAGAFAGNLLLKKVTLKAVRFMVATGLIIFSVFLALGLI
ncbi:MAG: Sulfite exporter TauE/SafE [Crocinitomicaceae bacterium]|jgi:uncharacterized membrane protein YfcA|nr:Sulfite exporter TauE/SafE [Crocinitomicaceae bacterium]